MNPDIKTAQASLCQEVACPPLHLAPTPPTSPMEVPRINFINFWFILFFSSKNKQMYGYLFLLSSTQKSTFFRTMFLQTISISWKSAISLQTLFLFLFTASWHCTGQIHYGSLNHCTWRGDHLRSCNDKLCHNE